MPYSLPLPTRPGVNVDQERLNDIDRRSKIAAAPIRFGTNFKQAAGDAESLGGVFQEQDKRQKAAEFDQVLKAGLPAMQQVWQKNGSDPAWSPELFAENPESQVAFYKGMAEKEYANKQPEQTVTPEGPSFEDQANAAVKSGAINAKEHLTLMSGIEKQKLKGKIDTEMDALKKEHLRQKIESEKALQALRRAHAALAKKGGKAAADLDVLAQSLAGDMAIADSAQAKIDELNKDTAGKYSATWQGEYAIASAELKAAQARISNHILKASDKSIFEKVEKVRKDKVPPPPPAAPADTTATPKPRKFKILKTE